MSMSRKGSKPLADFWKRRLIVAALASAVFWPGSFPAIHAQQIAPLHPLVLTPFTDGKYWYLFDTLVYDIADTGLSVTVDQGFVTDLASIPRIFWTVLPTWGKHGAPAIVHDWLYWEQPCTREQADNIMLLTLEEYEVGAIRRWAIHRALRWGGSFSWKNNQQRKAQGETRVIPHEVLLELIRYPNVSWEQAKDLYSLGGAAYSPASGSDSPEFCRAGDFVPGG